MKTLYTVGYEGADIGDFAKALADFGIRTLIDIREVPLSRKRGFSKRALSENMTTAGVKYLHIGQLGDPKAGRDAARRGDFASFRRIFKKHLGYKATQVALDEAIRIASASKSCLLCFERDPENCHRLIVAETMAARRGFAVVHLGANPDQKSRGSLHAISHEFGVA